VKHFALVHGEFFVKNTHIANNPHRGGNCQDPQSEVRPQGRKGGQVPMWFSIKNREFYRDCSQ